MGRVADMYRNGKSSSKTNSARHSTSTGGDPLRSKKRGGGKASKGKIGGIGR
jgi:hypothetical protein